MLGWILYAVGGMTIAMVLSLLLGLLRSGDSDRGPLRLIAVTAITVLAGPFAAVEIQTKIAGEPMAKAVKNFYEELPIQGEMIYYKVLFSYNNKARVVVVGTERDKWGGTDRPAVELSMEKSDSGWSVASYRVLHSERMQKDEISLPPYN